MLRKGGGGGVIARVWLCFNDVMVSTIASSVEDYGLDRWSGQP